MKIKSSRVKNIYIAVDLEQVGREMTADLIRAQKNLRRNQTACLTVKEL